MIGRRAQKSPSDAGPFRGVAPIGIELVHGAQAQPLGEVRGEERELASLAGERPAVSVQGEAQFAADIQWLADNLRWDIEADLARIVGPLPARQLASLGAAIAAGLRRWAPAADKP